MIFLSPMFFLTLLVFIPIVLVLLFLYGRKKRILSKLYNQQYIKQLNLQKFLIYKMGASLFVIAGITFALSSPVLVTQGKNFETSSASTSQQARTYILLDVSRSMYVRDSQNNTRIYTAVQFLKKFANEILQTDDHEIGLIIFSDKPALVSPLSSDIDYLTNILQGFISNPGIEGSSDLQTVVTLLRENKRIFFPQVQNISNRQKIVSDDVQLLVISDGEFHTFTNPNIFSQFAKEGFLITTVAVGSKEGGVVPNTNSIKSKANHSLMKNLARFSGGQYIEAETNIQNSEAILNTRQTETHRDLRFVGYFIAFVSFLIYAGAIIL